MSNPLSDIRRRRFIAFFGGVMAWPRVASAQQGDRVRRIGILRFGDENDPALTTCLTAFTQAGCRVASQPTHARALVSDWCLGRSNEGQSAGCDPRSNPRPQAVQHSTKVEPFLNLKTAKGLGLTLPLSLLDRADGVIE